MRTAASSLQGMVPISGLSICLLFAQSVLFAQLSDFQVNDIRGSAIEPHWNEPGVSLCVNDSGGFVITWTDGRNGNPDIYAQRYSRIGTALGSNFRVNDDVGSVRRPNTPSISTDKGGNFVIVWAERFDDGQNICAQHYSANGTPLGSNFQVNSIPRSLNPCVSSSDTGGFIVSWDASGSIYAQRFSGDGRTLGSNFRVDDDTTFQRKSSVAMDRDGNFVIVWTDDSRNGGPDIYAQLYSSDGTALGSNFKVNDEVGYIWYSYSGPPPPSVAADSSGNFVIAWNDSRVTQPQYTNGDVYAQRYSNKGIALGGNLKVNDDIDSSAQWFASISMDDNGDFVIAWNDDRRNSYYCDIYAQRYTSDGNKIDNNFLVTESSDTRQHGPCVKLWNGRMHTAWTATSNEGAGFDVWANVLDWNRPVGIADFYSSIPSKPRLAQNYPNPFNPSTTIKYGLPNASEVRLSVYDMLGREVSVLVNERRDAGIHEIKCDGSGFASGVYFYRLQAEDFVQTKRLIVVK